MATHLLENAVRNVARLGRSVFGSRVTSVAVSLAEIGPGLAGIAARPVDPRTRSPYLASSDVLATWDWPCEFVDGTTSADFLVDVASVGAFGQPEYVAGSEVLGTSGGRIRTVSDLAVGVGRPWGPHTLSGPSVDAIRAAGTVTSEDRGRAILGCVYLSDGLAVATDTYRMAILPLGTDRPVTGLVGPATLAGLAVAKLANPSVWVDPEGYSGMGGYVSCGTRSEPAAYRLQVAEAVPIGTYPDYRAIAVDCLPDAWQADVAELEPVLRAAAKLARGTIPAKFTVAGSTLTVSVSAPAKSVDFRADVPVRTFGAPADFLANPQYVASMAKLAGRTVRIGVADPMRAFTVAGPDGRVGLAMPMRDS